MGFIPENVIDEILSKVDIVDLVGRYLPLKRAGSNHKGVCPFHSDKDPSLSVNQDKGLWKCFGCGLGGNVITFVQKKENLEFPDAVRYLADMFQIDIPDETPGSGQVGRSRILFAINRNAEDYYIRVLKSKFGRPYREYLNGREFTKEAIESFFLGACLPGDIRDGLTRELTKKGYPIDELFALGLTKSGSYGGYDAFRERLIFPIRDVLARTVGFGARLLAGEGPKYINSPESDIFKKGEVLYGIDKAKAGIRAEGFILLMEGYTDVMRCHQHGLKNAVAAMGTALTEKQVRVLKRFSDDIILCFDADEPGQKAAERSLPALLAMEMNPSVLLIPKGEDPDSILRLKGPDEFRKMLEVSIHFIDFLLSRATKGRQVKDVEGKIEAFKGVLPILDAVPLAHLKAEYLERIAKALSINPDILRDVARARRQGGSDNVQAANIKVRVEGESKVEKECIAGLMQHPKLAPLARTELIPDDFNDELHAEVYSIIIEPSFPLEASDLSLQPLIYENKRVFSFVVDCVFSGCEREITERSARNALYMLISRKLKAINSKLESHHESSGDTDDNIQTEIISNRHKLDELKKKLIG